MVNTQSYIIRGWLKQFDFWHYLLLLDSLFLENRLLNLSIRSYHIRSVLIVFMRHVAFVFNHLLHNMLVLNSFPKGFGQFRTTFDSSPFMLLCLRRAKLLILAATEAVRHLQSTMIQLLFVLFVVAVPRTRIIPLHHVLMTPQWRTHHLLSYLYQFILPQLFLLSFVNNLLCLIFQSLLQLLPNLSKPLWPGIESEIKLRFLFLLLLWLILFHIKPGCLIRVTILFIAALCSWRCINLMVQIVGYHILVRDGAFRFFRGVNDAGWWVLGIMLITLTQVMQSFFFVLDESGTEWLLEVITASRLLQIRQIAVLNCGRRVWYLFLLRLYSSLFHDFFHDYFLNSLTNLYC